MGTFSSEPLVGEALAPDEYILPSFDPVRGPQEVHEPRLENLPGFPRSIVGYVNQIFSEELCASVSDKPREARLSIVTISGICFIIPATYA